MLKSHMNVLDQRIVDIPQIDLVGALTCQPMLSLQQRPVDTHMDGGEGLLRLYQQLMNSSLDASMFGMSPPLYNLANSTPSRAKTSNLTLQTDRGMIKTMQDEGPACGVLTGRTAFNSDQTAEYNRLAIMREIAGHLMHLAHGNTLPSPIVPPFTQISPTPTPANLQATPGQNHSKSAFLTVATNGTPFHDLRWTPSFESTDTSINDGCIDLSMRGAVDLNAREATQPTGVEMGVSLRRQRIVSTEWIAAGEPSSTGFQISDSIPVTNAASSVNKNAQTPHSPLPVKSEASDLEGGHTDRLQLISSSSTVRSKNRKSGFQAGVTVGYTYDAFFVSDGRSRRCKIFDSQKQQTGELLYARPRERNRSEPLGSVSCSSSAHSSNSSGAYMEATGSSTASSSTTSNSLSPVHPSSMTVPKTKASNCPQPLRGGSRYSCVECGKSYATSSNLSRHKQTHRSLDSHAARKCPHCGKAYVSIPALSMHILTHDLKHRCDLCGKAFSRPWLLQGHRRAHTGEKPYGCAHCGRAFADRSNLRAHMQTHSGMKQWTCPNCDKTFALKSYLNKHLESTCVDRCETDEVENPGAYFDLEHEGVYDGATDACVGDTVQPQKHTPDLAWSVTRLLDDCH